jgi:hypothetical protein
LKKQAEEESLKAQQQESIPTPADEPSQGQGPDVISLTRSELPVPKFMANRNKKKGFMKEMSNVQGTKIVFGETVLPLSEPTQVGLGSEVEVQAALGQLPVLLTPQKEPITAVPRRVLPPSEMDLPSNVFVTHQVYDRRGWQPKGKAAKRRAKVVEEEVEADDEDEDENEQEEEKVKENEQPLPTTPNQVHEEALGDTIGYEDMWTKAENRFEDLPIINKSSLPAKESIIAWKVRQILLPFFEIDTNV